MTSTAPTASSKKQSQMARTQAIRGVKRKHDAISQPSRSGHHDDFALLEIQRRRAFQRAAKRQKTYHVVAEDDYVLGLRHIIERDYFPDLKLLRKANHQLDTVGYRMSTDALRASATPAETPLASDAPRMSTMKRIRQEMVDIQRQAEQDDEEEVFVDGEIRVRELPKSAKRMRLSQFQSTFTSEDNASFAHLLEQDQKKHRAKFFWVDEQEKKAEQYTKMLTDSTTQGDKGQLKFWPYAGTNQLMFHPEQEMESKTPALIEKFGKKKIEHANTRFDSITGQLKYKAPEKPQEDPNASPKVAGYSFVSTPRITPGEYGESPQMTWGTLESTPTISGPGASSGGPRFAISEEPARDRVLRRLTDRIGKRLTRQRTGGSTPRISTSTPAFPAATPRLTTPGTVGSLLRQNAEETPMPAPRMQPAKGKRSVRRRGTRELTPAAQQLAARMQPKRENLRLDSQLRGSYVRPTSSVRLRDTSMVRGGFEIPSARRPTSMVRGEEDGLAAARAAAAAGVVQSVVGKKKKSGGLTDGLL